MKITIIYTLDYHSLWQTYYKVDSVSFYCRKHEQVRGQITRTWPVFSRPDNKHIQGWGAQHQGSCLLHQLQCHPSHKAFFQLIVKSEEHKLPSYFSLGIVLLNFGEYNLKSYNYCTPSEMSGKSEHSNSKHWQYEGLTANYQVLHLGFKALWAVIRLKCIS